MADMKVWTTKQVRSSVQAETKAAIPKGVAAFLREALTKQKAVRLSMYEKAFDEFLSDDHYWYPENPHDRDRFFLGLDQIVRLPGFRPYEAGEHIR